ncbi:MAG: protein kinase [Myxococcales bacterium]|nr:protein kinase [Myxococcales bacterium]
MKVDRPKEPSVEYVGTELGSYELIEQIGSGGMGMIFRAHHTRIGRTVAIKLLREDLVENKLEVERFLNEAKTVNRIGHPNIVDIYDFVEEWDRKPPQIYLVMELLEGKNLNEYLSEIDVLELAEAIDIALHICDGLSAVHDVNVLHRDLKPDNVFLTDDAHGRRRIKLLDFGIARGFAEGESSELTDPARMVGTPQYMSPEQVLSRPLDARTDIYAVGLVLYKMLSGRTPFDAAEVGSVLVDQVHKPPPPAVRPDGTALPEALQEVLTRCLQKAPADRYQTARELREALHDCRSALPSSAPDEAQAALPSLAPPRRRAGLVVGLIGVAALLLGVGAYWIAGRGDHAAVPTTAAGSASAAVAPTPASGAGSSTAAGAASQTRLASGPGSSGASAGTASAKVDVPVSAGSAKTADDDGKGAGSGKAVKGQRIARARSKGLKATRTRRTPRAKTAASPVKAGSGSGAADKPAPKRGRRIKERINRGGTLDPFGD